MDRKKPDGGTLRGGPRERNGTAQGSAVMVIASFGGLVLIVASSRVERSGLGLVGPARVDVAGLGALSRVELGARLVGRGAAGLLVERGRVDVAGMAAGAVFGSAAFAAGSGEVLALVLVVVSAAGVELGALVDVAGFGVYERSERSAVAATPRMVDVASLRAANA